MASVGPSILQVVRFPQPVRLQVSLCTLITKQTEGACDGVCKAQEKCCGYSE